MRAEENKAALLWLFSELQRVNISAVDDVSVRRISPSAPKLHKLAARLGGSTSHRRLRGAALDQYPRKPRALHCGFSRHY